ncbi:MAG TPA: abortive infection family protein [Arachnia sp.]|nr:abortive infection family protein [Arachnia sp.]HMT84810.1 abortive infection family protein [Arachnia sp.]
MSSTLLTDEVSAALGQFFYSGDGPSHATLTRCFTACGLADVAPYEASTGTPNKQQRVLTVCAAARRRPHGAGDKLMEQLLTALRIDRVFHSTDPHIVGRVATLRSALAANGAGLDPEGRLQRTNPIDLATGGRAALDEQLARLRHNAQDPGVLLGGAKELLESICKFVLEEQQMLPDRKMDFDELLALALDRLQLQPQTVNATVPGGKQLRAIYQSAKTTASTINELRNLQGTGHGRTLPTGISKETGRYVIREATHVAELLLSTHDRQMGRTT